MEKQLAKMDYVNHLREIEKRMVDKMCAKRADIMSLNNDLYYLYSPEVKKIKLDQINEEELELKEMVAFHSHIQEQIHFILYDLFGDAVKWLE